MTFEAAQSRTGGALAASVFGSLLLHVGIVAAFLALRSAGPPASPPIYRVNIVAAPTAVPAVGVVTPAPPATPAAVEKAPTRPKTDEVAPIPTKVAPKKVDKRATPNVSDTKVDRAAPAPVAGGGEKGSTGTDVANIRTEGTDFPFPGYLENIVRQIALRFKPPRGGSQLKAEVMFLIRRDGTISAVRFVQRSGSFSFDLEAQGAIEAAAKSFGPLPTGFQDDALPVVFSFDPRLIH